MSYRTKDQLAAAELVAFVLGYLVMVPLIAFTSLAWLAKGSSILWAMVLAPIAIWGLTFAYGIAFEGAKVLLRQGSRALLRPSARRTKEVRTSRGIYEKDLRGGAHGFAYARVPSQYRRNGRDAIRMGR